MRQQDMAWTDGRTAWPRRCMFCSREVGQHEALRELMPAAAPGWPPCFLCPLCSRRWQDISCRSREWPFFVRRCQEVCKGYLVTIPQ